VKDTDNGRMNVLREARHGWYEIKFHDKAGQQKQAGQLVRVGAERFSEKKWTY